MKILLINNVYGPEIKSGAERIVANLEKELLDKGHEVHVFDCSYEYKALSKKSTLVRLILHIFGFVNLGRYFFWKKIIKQYKPDLVWSHNLVGFGMISFLAFRKVLLLHTCHDIQLLHPSGLLLYEKEEILNSLSARFYQFLVNCVLPKKAFLVFPSQWLFELHKEHGLVAKRSYLIKGNPLRDSELFTHEQNNKYTFLYLGQLEKHKGILNLVSAFVSLPEKNIILKIAGEGSLKDYLVKNFNDPRLEYLGVVNNPEKIISQSDCVIAPSLCYENAPTVILESMSQNIPVIASNLGGTKELIKFSKLLFIPTENDIKKTLLWCLENKTELINLSSKNRASYISITAETYIKEIFSKLNLNL